jgi:bacterioferritin
MEAESLIEGLNRDLAQELATICRSIQQAALATGPAARDLRILLRVEVMDDLFHALFLADRIAALGGMPTATPAPFKTLEDAKDMLRYDLEMERQTIQHYSSRLHEAEGAWAVAIKARLERILVDEAEHERKLRELLDREESLRPAGAGAGAKG